MVGYEQILNAIILKLQTISEINVVEESHTENPTGYPSASVEPSSGENVIFSSRDNLRTYNHEIVLYQEYSTIPRAEAVKILAKVADAVIQAFDVDFSLSGLVHWSLAMPSQWGEFTGTNGKVLYVTLMHSAKTEVAVNPP